MAATQKAQETKHRPLAEIIRENFQGPFALKCVRGRTDIFPDARKFVPVDEDDFVEKMGIGAYTPGLMPVAAFRPRLDTTYHALVRQRPGAGIIEIVPISFGHGTDWQPQTKRSELPLVFSQNEQDRWSARHPRTGQIILLHKEFEMPASDKDGKVTVPAGQMELRPTMTRTFWVAGAIGTLEKISDAALEIYEVDSKVDYKKVYSFARQFKILGNWIAGLDVVGNPFRGLLELDNFTMKEIETKIKERTNEIERWVSRDLLPAIHPDVLVGKLETAENITAILEMADETRYAILELEEWFHNWSAYILSELRSRKRHGLPLVIAEPEQKPRKKRLLIELKRAEIERLLFKRPKPQPTKQAPAEPATSPKDKPVPKAAATATAKPKTVKKVEAKTAIKASGKPRGKIAPNGNHTNFGLDETNLNKLAQKRTKVESEEEKPTTPKKRLTKTA